MATVCCHALLAVLLLFNAANASSGRFEIVNASARYDAGDWLADTTISFELSDAAIRALQNGVTLKFEVQYEVTEYRRFWLNDVVGRSRQPVELRYMSLSQRYLVHWKDTDEQASYATLYSALRNMGQVRDYRLPVSVQPDAVEDYLFAVRVVMSPETLPGPVRMLSFWRSEFELESSWYQWQVK